MTYRDMAKKWRSNERMFKVLHRYYRASDPNYLDGKWVGSIEKFQKGAR